MTYGCCGPEAERTFARLQHKTNRFGKRFVARLALVVVKAAARQVLAALGRARETFGRAGTPPAEPVHHDQASAPRVRAELSLPPPPVAVPRPGAAPHPWDAAAQLRATLETEQDAEDETPTIDGDAAPTPTPTPAGEAKEGAEDDEAEAEQPERRRCTECQRDRPERAFAPAHWAGTNRGKANKRRCMSCAPMTTPAGKRFCSQCERAKNTREFGPLKDGRTQRVCRTCTVAQERLAFFVENSPRISE